MHNVCSTKQIQRLVLNGAPVELTLLAAGAVACFVGLLEPGALFEGCASDAAWNPVDRGEGAHFDSTCPLSIITASQQGRTRDL